MERETNLHQKIRTAPEEVRRLCQRGQAKCVEASFQCESSRARATNRPNASLHQWPSLR